MSDLSPEIDCNCDNKQFYDDGMTICINCGRKYRMVPNGPDDYEWEEVD